jgi:Site-specific recombinase XerD
MPIIDCKLQEFQNIVDRYKEKSSTCVNTIKTVIQGICGYAMRYDIIPKDYSDYIIVRSTESTEDKHRPFTIEEINALWNEPRDDVRDIVLILLYSGWRINELLDLDGLDLDNGIMTGGKKTKAGKNRIVPIHHRIEPLIREYKNGFGHKYLWFQTRIKDRYDHLPHDTRHTFISRLQSAGADRICIERLVGHASQSITDNVYTHKDVDDLRECIELLT